MIQAANVNTPALSQRTPPVPNTSLPGARAQNSLQTFVRANKNMLMLAGAAIAAMVFLIVLLGSLRTPAAAPGTFNNVLAKRVIKNAKTIRSSYQNMFDFQTLTSGHPILVHLNSDKRMRVADLFVYLSNRTDAQITAYISARLDCSNGILVGTRNLTASGETTMPRLVWIESQNDIWINGDFCVTLQTNPDSDVQIAGPLNASPLVIANLSEE